MTRTFEQHLDPDIGPKRILALDGGGIRGMVSLGILRRIEEHLGRPLSDHFDLIGGTSTGALIAAKLATGCSVDDIANLYSELGESVFRRTPFSLRQGVVRAKFSSDSLEEVLKRELRDMELGSPEIKTGFAVVAKRLDTGSSWILHNNPQGKYFDTRPDSNGTANKRFWVRDLLRASTAAPHYFDPVELTVSVVGGNPMEGLFVDGGVSPHNNPALLLLMLATIDGYRFRWPMGADRLQIVSVGTGTWRPESETHRGVLSRIVDRLAAGHAVKSLLSMMYDASALNELLLQWMSDSPTGRVIDSEIGDLSRDLLGLGPSESRQPLLSYVRYDAPLEYEWLTRELPSLKITTDQVKKLRAMDRSSSLGLLTKVGEAASDLVEPEHLVFDR